MKRTLYKRVGAFVIDLIIVGILSNLIEMLLPNIFQEHPVELWNLEFTYKLSVSFLIYLCYFILFDVTSGGRTIGKLIFKIRVINPDEESLTAIQHIQRSLLKMVSIIILPISILLFLLKDGYTIHGQIMHTETRFVS